ncbi:MAG: hypothetical protein AABW67_02575 [Nanoarchaeota archaeon]
MEKFQENLREAIRAMQIADHMAYVTFPLVNEQRLLLKIFDEIHKSILLSITALLNYECLHKNINIYTDNQENLKTFQKCAKQYNISDQQIKTIMEIIELNIEHKASSMEFVRKDKIVILSDNLRTRTLGIQKIKEYLLLAKELLMKVNLKTKE